MEVGTSHNDQEVVPKDTMDQETTASQGSSNNTSNISSTEVVAMTTATSADTIFNLATIESGTGPSDNVVSKIDDELHPTATASVGAESAELPQAAVTVAVRNPGTITTEEDMYEEEQTNVETDMRMSTTDSDRLSLENKTNIQDLEDILPMEQQVNHKEIVYTVAYDYSAQLVQSARVCMDTISFSKGLIDS